MRPCRDCPLCVNWQYDHSKGAEWYGCPLADVKTPGHEPTQLVTAPFDGKMLLSRLRNRTLAFTGEWLSESFVIVGATTI
jgi:hypothetical protein